MMTSSLTPPSDSSADPEILPPEMEEARAALQNIFGFSAFKPGQEEVLRAAYAGENILAVMPTGSGKSLCYQLPALTRNGLTIVVSPLIALMRDQVRQLQNRGIAAEALNSANSGQDNFAIRTSLLRGAIRLLYVAPERLVRSETIELLKQARANVLAIDEAHCVSQWGHDFRPEYRALGEIGKELGIPQIIAVTATADAKTRTEIIQRLFPAPPKIFVRSFDRPNIRLAMARKRQALSQIEAMVKKHRGQTGIIYCASRKTTEKFAELLCAQGHPALAYHAGLPPEIRAANQDEFVTREGRIIVATIAFGMGIDKPDVRYVCHADLPQSIEAYYQEIGRAGRDGLKADTLTLYSEADILNRERQIKEGDAPLERKHLERRKLNDLIALCETPRCRRQALLAAFGESSSPCGNCDICEGKWGFFNGIVTAQKLLSAVHRTSGRFFPGHLANLLIGKTTEAIKKHGHHLLPTFGAGKELSQSEWRSIFHQLHSAELIAQDADDRDRWFITQEGREVLSGTKELQLRSEPGLPARRPPELVEKLQQIERDMAQDETPPATQYAPKSQGAETAHLSVNQHKLLAALKQKRLELARAKKQAAFIILPDSVLIEMAVARPKNEAGMRAISGMGPVRMERYGKIFLEIVSAHSRD